MSVFFVFHLEVKQAGAVACGWIGERERPNRRLHGNNLVDLSQMGKCVYVLLPIRAT